MADNMTCNSRMLLTLSSIEAMAKHLAEPHLLQQYANETQQLVLTNSINSAFRSLEQCVDILRPRSPMSQLPKEILGLIFYATQNEDWAEPYVLTRKRPRTRRDTLSPYIPLVLSQVSRLWRDISINLPKLWTAVKICSPWQFQSIRISLSRSKLFPIDLQIMDYARWEDDYDDCDDEEAEEENSRVLCEILAPHIDRCRSIYVSADFQYSYLYFEMLVVFAHTDARLLKTLSIISEAGDRDYDPRFLFASAPLLSDVRLNLTALFVGRPPLDHVTSLCLTARPATAFSPAEFFDFLSECRALEELYLYNQIIERWNDDEVADHSMAALHSIHFYGSTSTRSDILRSLEAPSLEHILLAPFSHQEEFAHSFFETHGSMTDRFPLLSTVTLLVNDVSGDWFGDVGDLFPDIESLFLAGASSGLASEKATGGKRADVLPNLRTLALRDVTEGAEDELCTYIACREALEARRLVIYLNPASFANMRRLDWLQSRAEIIEWDAWLDRSRCSKVIDNPDFSYYDGLPSLQSSMNDSVSQLCSDNDVEEIK